MNIHRPEPSFSHNTSASLLERFRSIRAQTERLAEPLSPEDQLVQSMPDASPAKWHRAHTTWFFETFVLGSASHRPFRPEYSYLFNSYYEEIGDRHPRPSRGLLTRPSAEEIGDYRRYVDAAMEDFIAKGIDANVAALIELGLHHEQQHQELLLTDILHAFAQNPILPAYGAHRPAAGTQSPMRFMEFPGGLCELGHTGEGFAFDNEGPRHQIFLQPYALADRAVTNREWLEFMGDGGYRDPRHWLSDGWRVAREENWSTPLYWREQDNQWYSMTLAGLQPLDLDAPVTHISFYEADAFARWSGKRLPSEAEWETAGLDAARAGNFVETQYFRPLAADGENGALKQMFGDVWEWTQSSYAPYPGYVPPDGAIGEYNGKFMVNQMVLRGGSCATPASHIRATYRNFFYPHQRWQFTGLRLAADLPLGKMRGKTNETARFREDAWEGLSRDRKALPPKYFYDAEGMELFEAICRTPEYYPMRTEIGLLKEIAADLEKLLDNPSALVEFGSGSNEKARILLRGVRAFGAYAPVDICEPVLLANATAMAREFKRLAVFPVTADFAHAIVLPENLLGYSLFGFFPGSTIGNFAPEEAAGFLRDARTTLGDNAYFLVGIDLVKDEKTLFDAYNDASGVTAQFNKNILARMNRELNATFDLDDFEHRAFWNQEEQYIEMHLVSRRDHSVTVAGRSFSFREGETIHTENSRKFTLEAFRAMAHAAGWSVTREWKSHEPAFAAVLLSAN